MIEVRAISSEGSRLGSSKRKQALGGAEALKEASVPIPELLEALLSSAAQAVSTECEVTIEVSATASIEGSAGTRFLVFDIGGKAAASQSVKLQLRTKVTPVK